MHGTVARKAFQSFSHVDQSFYLLIRFVCPPEFRIFFQCLINSNVKFLRDHLCDGIHKSIRKIHHTAHIPDHASCSQCSECHDLDYTVFPVFANHIVNHFLPAFKTEVHINIRHRYTFRIKETLKQELITDRINGCNLQTIRNNTAGRRASPRPYCDSMVLRIFDKIPDNKEIIHISHIPDRIKLVSQPVFQFLGRFAISSFQPFPAKFLKIFPGRKSFRHIKFGKLGHAEFYLHRTPVRDPLRIVKRLKSIRKKLLHFFRRFYIVLTAFIAHSVLIC